MEIAVKKSWNGSIDEKLAYKQQWALRARLSTKMAGREHSQPMSSSSAAKTFPVTGSHVVEQSHMRRCMYMRLEVLPWWWLWWRWQWEWWRRLGQRIPLLVRYVSLSISSYIRTIPVFLSACQLHHLRDSTLGSMRMLF